MGEVSGVVCWARMTNVTSVKGSVWSFKSHEAGYDAVDVDVRSAWLLDSYYAETFDLASRTVCVGVGINNTFAVDSSECGAAAPNILGVNVNVAKESASSGASSLVCNALVVSGPACNSIGDDVEPSAVAEWGKKVPAGRESFDCMSGATGSGLTGALAVNVVVVSGTKASGHDLYTMTEYVRCSVFMAECVLLAEEARCKVDATIAYAFSADLMCSSTNIEWSVSTKMCVASSNPVCLGTADEVVASVVSDVGETCGHARDPFIFVV